MKWLFLALTVALCPLGVCGQSSSKKAQVPPHPNGPATEDVQTETIGPGLKTPPIPSTPTGGAGYLEPAQVKVLTHKIWVAEYHLTDLLTQVHPEKWKVSPAVQKSFGQSLDSLRQAMANEENWRGQFDARPDSLYLGFQTYVAISAVLPRLDGMVKSVSKYENPSFGGQYSQSANQLFDLQQELEPHLAYLLKNQDDAMLVVQSNMASCQNELNYALHNKNGRAIPMKNFPPDFKGRKRTTHPAAAPTGSKQSTTKDTSAAKPAASPPKKAPDN